MGIPDKFGNTDATVPFINFTSLEFKYLQGNCPVLVKSVGMIDMIVPTEAEPLYQQRAVLNFSTLEKLTR